MPDEVKEALVLLVRGRFSRQALELIGCTPFVPLILSQGSAVEETADLVPCFLMCGLGVFAPSG